MGGICAPRCCRAHPEGCRSAPHGDEGYPCAPQYRRPTPRTWLPRRFQALPAFIKSQTHTVITSFLPPGVYRAPSNGAEIPPRGPTNTLGERPEGPGRGNEKLPRTGNAHLGATGLPGPPDAIIIHPHRSLGEGGRGHHHPRALPPVREERGCTGQGTEGSPPRGHIRAGTKHGSPLSPGAGETGAAVPTEPQTPVWNQPATERTGCATGHRGGPPLQERPRTITGSRTSQPGRQLRPRGARSRQSARGSHSRGLTPSPPSLAPSLARPVAPRGPPAPYLRVPPPPSAAAPAPATIRPEGRGGRERGVPGHAPPPTRHVRLAGPPPTPAALTSPAGPASRAVRRSTYCPGTGCPGTARTATAPRAATARTAPARAGPVRTATARTTPVRAAKAPRAATAPTATAPRAPGGGGTGFGAECAGRQARMTLPGAAAARGFPELVPLSDSAQEFHSLGRNRASPCPHPSRRS